MEPAPRIDPESASNLRQAVPFFAVSNIENSLRFYVTGLGFEMTKKWIDEGKLRWCWLQKDAVAIMLQQFRAEGPDARPPLNNPGQGISICFQCNDAIALYREFNSRGIPASEPFVGNNMWVTTVRDPDGYTLDFESSTDAPEGTKLSEWKP
jgi:lactoylglutathione lyase